MSGPDRTQLTKFACLACRKTFKRPAGHCGNRNIPRPIQRRVCPHCGENAYLMGSNFRTPVRSDDLAWRVVDLLVSAGFPYFDVGRPYPTTLPDARRFIAENRALAQPFQ